MNPLPRRPQPEVQPQLCVGGPRPRHRPRAGPQDVELGRPLRAPTGRPKVGTFSNALSCVRLQLPSKKNILKYVTNRIF